MPYADPADKAAWAKRYHAEHRDRVTETKRAWAARNRQKRAAHVIVGNAIRDGRLTRMPCDVCGDEIVEAHHDDYDEPMSVRWLCGAHHKEHHVAERKA